jgi:glycerophosphoryl diester phosphodiesterase
VAPENTLAAFRLAGEVGAGGLEMDLHMTRDGRIVVIHDPTLERTTDGTGTIKDLTFEEVRAADAGHRFTPDGGRTYPYRGKGLKVPTFAEVLSEFPAPMAINADIKESRPGFEEVLLDTIRGADAEGRVLVVSQDPKVMRRFRALSGGRVSTGALRREIRAFYFASRIGIEGLLHPPYKALQVPTRSGTTEVVTPRFVEAAHRRGVRVDVWTIDEPAEMRRLLDLRVDVIMTNHPEALATVLDENRNN